MDKRNRKITPIIMLCVILALMLIPSMFISSYIINHELEIHTKQTLGEISDQSVNLIRSKVKSDFLLMEETADHIQRDTNIDSTMSKLKDSVSEYGYKRLEIIYTDSTFYSTDNLEHNIMNDDHVQQAFKGKSVLSDVHADSGDKKPIYAYSVPVYDNTGGVIAVLTAVIDVDSFRDHISVSAFGGREYTYIVKSNGEVAIPSAHSYAYKDITDIFKAMDDVGKNDKVIKQLRTDMLSGKKGCLSYINNGQYRYINYAPLEINDWYIISIAPADVTNGSRFRIMLVVYIIFVVVAIITITFLAGIIKTENAKRLALKKILYTDELTGGMTFTKFCIDAKNRIEYRIDKSKNVACAMIDLENFRLINNLYGKNEGDKTIINCYEALKLSIGEYDLLARHMADKFYVLMFFDNEDELDSHFSKFMDELKNPDNNIKNEHIINPCIGVYIANTDVDDIETITSNATIAHDTVKSHGSRVVFYDESQRERLKMNKLLEDKMEFAHKNNEFIPYYQPKYDAFTGKICGAEALVRWKQEDGSIIMPNAFIPLAESNGFIRVLDKDVFNAVCAFQKKVIKNGIKSVPISVNVSRQLMFEKNFTNEYIDTIKTYNLDPKLVELEITESVLFDNYIVFGRIIDSLRKVGFNILMDDFGTGYSSLMMLGSVPIDNLKLDKSFIDSFEEEKGRKIIISVIELAKSLSLPLTAEGVETHKQFEFLKEMGCDIIQGYYFSKPVPEEEFLEMLKKEDIS